MAVESYGRTDDGIAWEVCHRLWSGPWWWVLTMPDGQVRQSPDMYETERQARDAVEDARRQALAGLPVAETMTSLRTRAEAAEARAAAVSLVCAHCGPESAGPAAGNDRACATCYGTLILTDAAGAAELRRRYDDAVGEAAEARAAQAQADLDALARTVGAAIVAGSLAPGESLTSPPQHAIVSTVNRLRARAEKAEAQACASAEAMLRDLCAYLNEMVAIDPMMMYRLVYSRTICNHATFYRLTERHVSIADVGCLVGMLGLLNGWLSSRTRLTIMAHFDHDRGAVERFEVGDYSPEEIDGEEPTAGGT